MLNKFYSFIKDILRENYKFIVFLIILVVVLKFPLPYYIFTAGGISDLNNKFEIEESYEQKGSYNLSYVTQLDGNVLTYLLSYVVPGWDLVEINDYQVNENETFEEMMNRDRLSLTQANQMATIIAYTWADKDIKINNSSFYVVAVYDYLESDKKISIGDMIKKIDNVEVTDFKMISNYIATKEFGEYVELEFDHNGELYTTKVKINNIDNKKVMGLVFYQIFDLEVDPKIEFKFSNTESGSSAGLMTTLAIYDTLIPEDLTGGYKIAGTGTIDLDGTVGEIAGVKYKLSGAEKGGAKVFFVPTGDNYKEAMEVKKKRGYDIEIVEIKTFDDAINYLKNMKSEKE